MHQLGILLISVLEAWVLCLIIRAILSWFPISYGSTAHRINSVLVRITEPVISPIRRLIPPVGSGGVSIDLSFIIVIIAIQVAIQFIRASML